MRHKLVKLAGLATLPAVVGLGHSASALTINQAIQQAAVDSGRVGQTTTYAFNDLSVADYFDLDNNNAVTVGDVILGGFVMDEVTTSQGSGGSGPLTDVSGVYALQVGTVSVPTTSGGVTATFNPVDATQDDAVGTQTGGSKPSDVLDISNDEMFGVYQGGGSTNASVNPPSGAYFNTNYNDGDLYTTLTESDTAGFGYKATFVSNNLTTLNNVTSGSNAGTTDNSYLNIKDDGTSGGEGIGDQMLSNFGAGPDVFGEAATENGIQSSDEPSSINADYVFNDTANVRFRINAVPTPAALIPGLAMFGLMGFRRRRKQADAVA